MTTTDLLDDELREIRDEYRRKVELLETELVDAKKTMEAYGRVMNDRRSRPRPERGSKGGSGLHAGIRTSQLSHCKTQREAWVEIARLSGGLAKPSEGAQLLIDVGLAKKPKRETASNGSSWMSNSDRWERVGKGVYRLLEFVADGSPDEEGPGDRELVEDNSQGGAWHESPGIVRNEMVPDESPEQPIG